MGKPRLSIPILSLLLLIANAFGISVLAQDYQEKDLWYVGGTLHSATIVDWKSATSRNRLATCADYVALIKKRSGTSYGSMVQLKRDAIEMMSCINEAVSGNDKIYKGMKINEIAAACAILLQI